MFFKTTSIGTKMNQALILFILGLILGLDVASAVYYGTEIGDFANRFHQVRGKVYAVDSRTIFIKVSLHNAQWEILTIFGS